MTALPSDATMRELAASERVCVRPILQRVTDTITGTARTVVLPCGATRAKVCPSCADAARRLRIQQCREGWHLWDAALDAIDDDADAMPAHVIRAGSQVDIQGVIAGTSLADRVIGYLTKYLTKSITDPLHDSDGEAPVSAARCAHIDRLSEEVRWLPCSPTCANWLRYGIQPKDAQGGMEPGRCGSKAHDRDHLGLGGRRVLVSRRWTGKTLDHHRADRAAVVKAVLAEAGIEMDDHDELSATAARPDGLPRFVWTTTKPGDLNAPAYTRLIAHTIAQKHRWRTQYEHAKTRAGSQAPGLSATAPPATPAAYRKEPPSWIGC